MAKQKPINNIKHAIILLKVYEGLSRKEIEFYLGEMGENTSNLGNDLLSLTKLKLLKANVKYPGRGLGKRVKYSLNYEGILNFIEGMIENRAREHYSDKFIEEIKTIYHNESIRIKQQIEPSLLFDTLNRFISLCKDSKITLNELFEGFIYGVVTSKAYPKDITHLYFRAKCRYYLESFQKLPFTEMFIYVFPNEHFPSL